MAAKLWSLRILAVLAFGSALISTCQGALKGVNPNNGITLPMHHDPLLPKPKTEMVNLTRLIQLWAKALHQPDIQTKALVCASIARAGRSGITGLNVLDPTLDALARTGGQPNVLRHAVVMALAAINNPTSAEAVLQEEKFGGLPVELCGDPALERWRYKPACPWWRSRLKGQASQTPETISAIQALGVLNDQIAIPALNQIIVRRSADIRIRLASAQALAELQATGLATRANWFLADPNCRLETRLIAVYLVKAGRTTAQRYVLNRLLADHNSAVQLLAAEALFHSDWRMLLAPLPHLVVSQNSGLRLLAARVAKKSKNIIMLHHLLNDQRRIVRWFARDALVDIGRVGLLRKPICQMLLKSITVQQPRQQKQAALALGMIDDKAAANGLMALLADKDHPGVRLSALVSLRRLAVPDTFSTLLKYASGVAEDSQRVLTSGTAQGPNSYHQIVAWGHEMAQIFNLFGMSRYAPSDPLMQKLIPKHSPYAIDARASAIWALGKIHVGQETSPLIPLFQSRLADDNILDPEAPAVRRMSAISLGRLGSKSSLGELTDFYTLLPASRLGMACRWSIWKLTGKWQPAGIRQIVFYDDFLQPHNQSGN